ncbi:MAG: winged helix-turn-helix domain-containing protein, partial [Acidobacteriota bacterium]
MPDGPVEIYRFGDFQLNVGERTLERRTRCERIVIPEKAFQALVLLVRSSGALVTKDSILATVWPGVLVEEGNIGKAIHAIRRALGDGTGEWSYIETVPKHGYRFIADVTSIAKSHAVSSSAVPVVGVVSGRSPAYDLYVRARVKTGGENLDDTNEAIALLEAAVEIDPACAVAYAQLARAYTTRSFKFASQDGGRRFRENADVALAKALDLAPNLAEAHF